MKFPYPTVKTNCDVLVSVSETADVNGASQFGGTYSGKAYRTDHIKWVQTADGKRMQSVGKVIIFGNICPNIEKLTGVITINGIQNYLIVAGSRFYNPDSSIHHIELELM